MMFALQPDGVSSPADGLRDIVDRLDRKEPAEALALLRPLIEIGAPSLTARFVLAMTAWTLERFDWALSLLRECHNEAPNNGGIADALASLLAQLGKLEESLFIGKLATAYGVDPDIVSLVPKAYPSFDSAFLSIVEHPVLAAAHRAFAQGKLDKATEYARQHTVIDPDHREGRVFYAQCLMQGGSAAATIETLNALDGSTADGALLSLYARALTATGEVSPAILAHREAGELAPHDAAIAAAQVVDAPFLGADPSTVAALSQEWANQFSLAPKSVRKHGNGGKLVIAYLVSTFNDAGDAAAVAAVAQAHDRSNVTVLGYGCRAQTAEQNALLTGAFTKWRDIADLDPATLARTFGGDSVDVLVDAGGFASPTQLQALSRCDTALRVSWFGNAAGIVAPLYDARLTHSDYPVLPVRNPCAPRLDGPIAFGADCALAQLDAKTVALWAAVLVGVPGAKLVLRGRDMQHSANIARLIARFGESLAARIDLRNVAHASYFYDAVDIALMPMNGPSPRAAAEALAYGVPALAVAGSPYAEFLAGMGLSKTHVAADAAHYQMLATHFAASADARRLPILDAGPAKLARAIEELAVSLNSREHAA